MSLMGSYTVNDKFRDNVWYPRPAAAVRDRQDVHGCVAAIALIALCAASFWFGMWLGSVTIQSASPHVETE